MVSDARAWLRARVVVAAAADDDDDDDVDGRWQAQHALGGLKGGQRGMEAVRSMLARLLACRRCRHPAMRRLRARAKTPRKSKAGPSLSQFVNFAQRHATQRGRSVVAM